LPMNFEKTILILGGTTEAAALAKELSIQENIRTITSLAGRTKNPAKIAGEVRTGGFGGVFGMVAYFSQNKIDEVVDATHPFATKISSTTKLACKLSGLPLKRVSRAAWKPRPKDDWQMVDNIKAAKSALPEDARAFLALGSQHLDVFSSRDDIHFVARMVDAPSLPLDFKHLTIVEGLPGNSVDDEKKLFETHGISHLVCRNSGGERGRFKLDAARELGIGVVMIIRPRAIHL